MNKNNFKLLIDAIEKDGKLRFNMSSFVGELILHDDNYNRLIVNGPNEASYYGVNMLHSVQTTEMFNCNSVGCVAGFAVAIANNWRTPDWLKTKFNDSINSSFENEANKFLGLSDGQGKKIYYNDEDSLWKYLAFHRVEEFPNLELATDDFDLDIDDCEDWLDNGLVVNFKSIDYRSAIKALTLIMNEEIILGHDFGDITIGCKV